MIMMVAGFLAVTTKNSFAETQEIHHRISVKSAIEVSTSQTELEKKAGRIEQELKDIEKKLEQALNVQWNQSTGILLFKSEKSETGFKGVSFDNFKIVFKRGERSFFAGHKDNQVVAGMSLTLN